VLEEDGGEFGTAEEPGVVPGNHLEKGGFRFLFNEAKVKRIGKFKVLIEELPLPCLKGVELAERLKNEGREWTEEERFDELGSKPGEGFPGSYANPFLGVQKRQIGKGCEKLQRGKREGSPGDRLTKG
jgi:hypothetical protein